MGTKCVPGCGCGKHRHVPTTRYDKICEECGAPFVAKRVDARYCSGTCNSTAYYRENREKVRESGRRWMAAHRQQQREYHAQWWEDNGDEQRAKKRARYAEENATPELREVQREAQRKRRRERRAAAVAANPEEVRRQARVERASLAHRADWVMLFESLWAAQKGLCYLCSDPLDREAAKAIHLDHDHRCCPLGRSCERCRRGLACKDCNRLIGIARDNPARLRHIADALEAANALVSERLAQPRQEPQRWNYQVTCQVCGTVFATRRSDARFCSATCTSRARRGTQRPEVAPTLPFIIPTPSA